MSARTPQRAITGGKNGTQQMVELKVSGTLIWKESLNLLHVNRDATLDPDVQLEGSAE